jgi:hypothetical protein
MEAFTQELDVQTELSDAISGGSSAGSDDEDLELLEELNQLMSLEAATQSLLQPAVISVTDSEPVQGDEIDDLLPDFGNLRLTEISVLDATNNAYVASIHTAAQKISSQQPTAI